MSAVDSGKKEKIRKTITTVEQAVAGGMVSICSCYFFFSLVKSLFLLLFFCFILITSRYAYCYFPPLFYFILLQACFFLFKIVTLLVVTKVLIILSVLSFILIFFCYCLERIPADLTAALTKAETAIKAITFAENVCAQLSSLIPFLLSFPSSFSPLPFIACSSASFFCSFLSCFDAHFLNSPPPPPPPKQQVSGHISSLQQSLLTRDISKISETISLVSAFVSDCEQKQARAAAARSASSTTSTTTGTTKGKQSNKQGKKGGKGGHNNNNNSSSSNGSSKVNIEDNYVDNASLQTLRQELRK